MKVYLCALGFWLITGAVSQAWGEEVARVSYFVDEANDPSLVMINAGKEQGVLAGDLLNAYRPRAGGEPLLKTGVLKVETVGQDSSLARIQNGKESQLGGPVMAKDVVSKVQFSLARKQNFIEEFEFSFFDLFVDPKALPSTLELTDKGKDSLARMVGSLEGKAHSELIIKGYTDEAGPSALNQVESLERATTVKEYLVKTFGIAEERLLVVGMGELDLKDGSKTYGAERRNRRIVLKIASENRSTL